MQDEHTGRVLANQLHLENRWGSPCRAFNLHISLGDPVLRALSRIQETILAVEPSLLRVPWQAMHISAAWLLPVHLGLPVAEKEGLWREHGHGWLADIATGLRELRSFRLCYTDVVATDSAIIALAWPTDQVSELRSKLDKRLRLGRAVSAGDMVHTTLFRYAKPLGSPASLFAAMASLEVNIEVQATEFLVVRERVFPSLKRDVLDRFLLDVDTP